MFGSSDLYTALNQSDITDLLDDDSDIGRKALYSGTIVPNDTVIKSINFYMSGIFNPNITLKSYPYMVSCRASKYSESREIAEMVMNTINRNTYNNSMMKVTVLPTLSPSDSTDLYNTPIKVDIYRLRL